jgi:hypothetical protein
LKPKQARMRTRTRDNEKPRIEKGESSFYGESEQLIKTGSTLKAHRSASTEVALQSVFSSSICVHIYTHACKVHPHTSPPLGEEYKLGPISTNCQKRELTSTLQTISDAI